MTTLSRDESRANPHDTYELAFEPQVVSVNNDRPWQRPSDPSPWEQLLDDEPAPEQQRKGQREQQQEQGKRGKRRNRRDKRGKISAAKFTQWRKRKVRVKLPQEPGAKVQRDPLALWMYKDMYRQQRTENPEWHRACDRRCIAFPYTADWVYRSVPQNLRKMLAALAPTSRANKINAARRLLVKEGLVRQFGKNRWRLRYHVVVPLR